MAKHIKKPLVSYLGETYSCHINGNPLYLEYCNDKPNGKEGVICEYHVGSNFIQTGYKTGIVNAGVMSATFVPQGTQTLYVKPNKHMIKWLLPTVYLKNPVGARH